MIQINPHQNGYILRTELTIPSRIEVVFDFFSEAKNLEKITPPFLNFKIQGQSTPNIEQNTEIDYQLKLYGIPFKWKTLIKEWKINSSFTDYQLKGPYKIWSHTHHFHKFINSENQEFTHMTDEVYFEIPYSFPFSPLNILVKPFVLKNVQRIFEYRSQVIKEVFSSSAL